MQSATGCVILGNQDKMPWLTHPTLYNMSGSSLSLPQQKYIRTREFGHFQRDSASSVKCSRHHLGPLHWDSKHKSTTTHLSHCLEHNQKLPLSLVNGIQLILVITFTIQNLYERYWKYYDTENTQCTIFKLCKLLKISNCFAKQKTNYNHNYITLKLKHCHLNIVVTSCNTLGTCKPAGTPLLEGPTSKRQDVQVLELDHKFCESQVYLDLNKVA